MDIPFWCFISYILRDWRVVLPVVDMNSSKCLSSFSSESAQFAKFGSCLGMDCGEAALGHLRPGLIARNTRVFKSERTALVLTDFIYALRKCGRRQGPTALFRCRALLLVASSA